MNNLEQAINWLQQTQIDPINYSDDLYISGYTLLEANSKNRIILSQLKRGLPNPHKRRMLFMHIRNLSTRLYEIERLHANQSPTTAIKKNKSEFTQVHTTSTLHPIEWALLPEALKCLHTDKGRYFSQAGKAFWQLSKDNFGKDPRDITQEQKQKNALHAKEVFENIQHNVDAWVQLDYWEKYKKLKEIELPKIKPEIGTLSDVDLLKTLANRRSNISTYKKRLASATNNKKIIAIEQKIETLTQEVEALVNEKENRII